MRCSLKVISSYNHLPDEHEEHETQTHTSVTHKRAGSSTTLESDSPVKKKYVVKDDLTDSDADA